MDYFCHLQKSPKITGEIKNKADEIRTDISRRHHNPLSFCSVVERKYRLRDYFICGYAIEAASWFDTDAFQLWVKDLEANTYYLTFSQPEQNDRGNGTESDGAGSADAGRQSLCQCLRPDESQKYMQALAKDALEAHKQVINECDWLSDTSKQCLTGKLDAVRICLVYPDAWDDFSGLDLDGLDYYGMRRAIWLHRNALNSALIGTEVDDRIWSSPSLIGGNGNYSPTANSFIGAACLYDKESYNTKPVRSAMKSCWAASRAIMCSMN